MNSYYTYIYLTYVLIGNCTRKALKNFPEFSLPFPKKKWYFCENKGKKYAVEEVDFHTMLAVVDECRLQVYFHDVFFYRSITMFESSIICLIVA